MANDLSADEIDHLAREMAIRALDTRATSIGDSSEEERAVVASLQSVLAPWLSGIERKHRLHIAGEVYNFEGPEDQVDDAEEEYWDDEQYEESSDEEFGKLHAGP